MNTAMRNGVALVVLVVAAGCMMGPDFKPPAAPQAATYGEVGASGKTAEARGPGGAAQRFDAELDIPAQWWELFHNETLDASVQTALTNSPTLAQALARLRQAQETYNAQAGATRYPAVDAGLSASRQKVNPAAMGITGVPVPDPFNLFNATVSVSYALDIFGKNRRALEGLKAEVDRREFELEAARQTLAANVVLASIRKAEAERQIAVAQELVAARNEQMAIARKRFESGGISERELEGQGLALEQARAELPALDNQSAKIRRQLAVYLGHEPAAAPQMPLNLDDLHLPEELPASLPSELARQRPDIRAAEAVWHQACANVGVATANLYPQITLSGSLGSQRTDVGDLLDKMNVWSVGGELMQPIFHGGALRAQKRVAVAAYDEAAAAYRETVLRGLQEVADTMGALEADARTLEARTAAANHTQVALDIATRQHQEGAISLSALLDEQIRHLQAESDRVQAQAARHADTAALFHALGGGWWNRDLGGVKTTTGP
jgi:NodT family efflux transporter outer membrane factor (OMF) lipoprotein